MKAQIITQIKTAALLLIAMVYAAQSYAASSVASSIVELTDIAYGSDKRQVMDVYKPANASNAPVIFMVHGGAWRMGDKGARSVVKNKVSHWVDKGFVFISINYRMLPDIQPVEQAMDVEKALLFAQQHSREWGGSPDQFILMGHSAGAHLLSLLSSNYSPVINRDITPWLGTIAIDSAAYDVVAIMSAEKPSRFYKKAFGTNAAYWQQASPLYVISEKLPPFLAICSSKRKDDSCAQARAFTDKASALGTAASLLTVNFSHRKLNTQLGKDRCYTYAIDTFLSTLHPDVKALLSRRTNFIQKQCANAN